MELSLIVHGSRGRNALGKVTNLFMWLKFLNQILKNKWRSRIILCKHVDYMVHHLKVFIILTYLTQQFLMEGDFATQGTSGILLSELGDAPGIQWTEARDVANIPQCTRQTPQQSYTGQNVSSAEVDNALLNIMLLVEKYFRF